MTDAPPYFSLVVPTYNRADRIGATLASVVAQDDPDFECVVVDDGSTDATAAVVAGVGDARVRYVWQENRERGAARNHGTRVARGRYVYYLDSDDLVTPDHLSHARATLRALGEPEVLHARFARVEPGGRAPPVPQRYPADLHAALLRRNHVGAYLFVRRDVALATPYREDRRLVIGEDWYHALVLAAQYPVHVTARTTRLVVRHPAQSMAATPVERFEDAARLLPAYLREHPAFMRRHAAALPRIAAEMASLAALEAARAGLARRALGHLWRAVRANPALLGERRTLAIGKHLLRARRAA
jgi:glycosyltransferase involved in cell wall biosynthesis